jgi:hypothetical protein
MGVMMTMAAQRGRCLVEFPRGIVLTQASFAKAHTAIGDLDVVATHAGREPGVNFRQTEALAGIGGGWD